MAKKITELTPEQKARIPEIRDQWLRIGLAAEDYSKQLRDLRPLVDALYSTAKLPVTKTVLMMESPIQLQVAANLLSPVANRSVRDQVWSQVWDQVRDQVWSQVRDQVWDQVRDQVWSQVRDQVGNQVRDQVWDQVRDQVWSQVRDQVGNQVGGQVWDQVRGQVRGQVRDQVRGQVRGQVRDQVGDQKVNYYTSCYGAHDAGWLSFYSFFKEVCGLSCVDSLLPLMALSKEVGWFIPFSNVCILSRRPLVVHRNSKNQLHSEHGPAMAWGDGYKLYALFGVRFEESLAKSFIVPKVEEIDCREVLKIENVEQRSAVIRRIGVDRFVELLGHATLDTRDSYSLITVDIGTTVRTYLRMQNPSVDHIHIEAVHPDCKTVEQALSWRNFGSVTVPWTAPIILS